MMLIEILILLNLQLGAVTDDNLAIAEEPEVVTQEAITKDPENKSYSLPEIKVEGSKKPGKDDTADTTDISGEEIRNSTRSSTVETLSQKSSDIYVSGRGSGVHGVANGASGAIHIRGLGGSPNAQVLVVEDGVPDVQGIFGHPIPDAYVPFLMEEVRVVKGGDSTLYGSNALGGVILIESRWRRENGFELENDAAYGSFNTIRETASFLGRWDKWYLSSAFSYFRTDGHRDGSGGSNLVATANLRYKILPSLKLTLKNKVIHLQGEDPGVVTHPNSDNWYDVWRDNLALTLDYRHKVFTLRILPYLNVGIHRLYDGFYSEDYMTGATAEFDISLHETVNLLLGFSGEWIDGKVTDRIEQEDQPVKGLGNYAFYNQLTYKPVDQLSIVIGTRELYSSKYGFAFLYKGGVRWEFYKGLQLRSRVTRNFRQPTIRELYLPFPTANPNLKPEYSLNWDVSFLLDYKHIRFSVTGYRTQAENMIKYFGSWPSAEVVNIDQIVIWGVEGHLGLVDLGPVNIHLTGNWQDVGRYTKQNPDAKINFSLEIKHDFGEHVISGNVSGEWVNGLYMENYGREPIDDVFFMDLSVRYRYEPNSKRFVLEPYAMLRNFLNLDYEYIKSYPMPRINFLTGLKVRI